MIINVPNVRVFAIRYPASLLPSRIFIFVYVDVFIDHRKIYECAYAMLSNIVRPRNFVLLCSLIVVCWQYDKGTLIEATRSADIQNDVPVYPGPQSSSFVSYWCDEDHVDYVRTIPGYVPVVPPSCWYSGYLTYEFLGRTIHTHYTLQIAEFAHVQRTQGQFRRALNLFGRVTTPTHAPRPAHGRSQGAINANKLSSPAAVPSMRLLTQAEPEPSSTARCSVRTSLQPSAFGTNSSASSEVDSGFALMVIV